MFDLSYRTRFPRLKGQKQVRNPLLTNSPKWIPRSEPIELLYWKLLKGFHSILIRLSLLNEQIAKLRDEIKMLSSIGSAQHKAELTDVVQQLREKHAKEMIAWKGIVSELEGQLRAYKVVVDVIV